MKSYEEIVNEINTLKKEKEELEEVVRKLKYGNDERWKKEKELAENYIQLFGGYDGIKIPLDEEIKKAIGKYIEQRVSNYIENNEEKFGERLALIALRSMDYFKKTFKPIVQGIIEDLDFNVSFHSNEE